MEIKSPGSLYNGSYIQNYNINKIPSSRRNEVIADMLDRLELMERKGSGLAKIANSFPLNKQPIFESDENWFKVTLWNLNYSSKLIRESKTNDPLFNENLNQKPINLVSKSDSNKNIINNNVSNKQNKTSEQISKILDFSQNKETFKSSDVVELLKVKNARVRQILSKMINEGYLESIGKNKNQTYKRKI